MSGSCPSCTTWGHSPSPFHQSHTSSEQQHHQLSHTHNKAPPFAVQLSVLEFFFKATWPMIPRLLEDIHAKTFHNTTVIHLLSIYIAMYQTRSHPQTPFQSGNEAYQPSSRTVSVHRSLYQWGLAELALHSHCPHTPPAFGSTHTNTRMNEQHSPCITDPFLWFCTQ